MSRIAKVFGPYTDTRGRKVVHLQFDDGKRTSTTYERYLMEKKLGRKLTRKERVISSDRETLDKSEDGMVVVTASTHAALLGKERKREIKYFEFVCPVCKTAGKVTQAYMTAQLKRNPNYEGPYCNKICAAVGSRGKPRIRKER